MHELLCLGGGGGMNTKNLHTDSSAAMHSSNSSSKTSV